MLIPYLSKAVFPIILAHLKVLVCGGGEHWEGVSLGRREIQSSLCTMVWQMLEHLQSDQKGKVHTLEVTRTEAHDAQKEEPYLLRSEVVCAVAVDGICVRQVKQNSAGLNLARIDWGGQSEYLGFYS